MHIIEYKFVQIFRYMGLPEKEIRKESSFRNDFDFEEFQFNCLVCYISLYFKINVVESDYTELETIGSTMNFVRKKLAMMN